MGGFAEVEGREVSAARLGLLTGWKAAGEFHGAARPSWRLTESLRRSREGSRSSSPISRGYVLFLWPRGVGFDGGEVGSPSDESRF